MCASDGSPSTPIKSPYVTFASDVFSSISVKFSYFVMFLPTAPNVFVIKNNRFMDVHGAVVLDTFGSIVEYRMHVMISLYVHLRSTSFVFTLWVFRFWFL